MAHTQQLQFIKEVSQHLTNNYIGKFILEIGSYDVNGSVRSYFKKSNYVGVDLIEGPGVDIVCNGHELNYSDKTFDISISCECFEHNPYWVKTFINMYRMTKLGGVVIVTCATTGRFEHGTLRTSPNQYISPGSQVLGWNYYLNLTEVDFKKKIDIDNLFESYFFLTNKYSHDLYFIAVKKGKPTKFRFDNALLKAKCIEIIKRNLIKSKHPKILLTLYNLGLMPLNIFTGLPDKQYQNIAFFYLKFFHMLIFPAKYLYTNLVKFKQDKKID